MLKISNKLILFILSPLCLFAQIEASKTNILTANFEELTITNQYIFSSKLSDKNIDEITNNDAIFKFTNREFINTSIFSKDTWLKAIIVNNSELSDFIFEVNQNYVDSLKVFIVKNKKVLKTYPNKGLYFNDEDLSSFLQNKYSHIYPFRLSENDTISFYINAVINDGSFRTTNKIWSKTKYKERKKEIKIKSTYLIFFLGFTSLVLLLSLAMFFFSKRRLYLYYAGFVFVMVLNLITMRHFISPLFTEKYFFLGNNYSEMFGSIQIFFALFYINHFFSLKNSYNKLYKLLKIIGLATLLLFLLALFMRKIDWFYSFFFYISKIEMILVTLFLYGLSIYLSFKKNKMALYFVIAYTPLVIFVFDFILFSMNLKQGSRLFEWEWVIFFEILVLTIAMAHKYFLLMKENLVYQEKIHNQKIKISRDLHDNIGSQLTFIISSIDNLRLASKSSSNLKFQNKLTEIKDFTGSAISQLRDTIWAMNKNEIPFEDFYSRVLSFIEKAKQVKPNAQFNVDNAITSNPIFSSVKGINAYRVIQEAINNAIKYSEATEIITALKETKDHIILTVYDNGIGFDLNKIELGNGLENMQKRMDEIDANLKINSSLKKGTEIIITLNKNTINVV